MERILRRFIVCVSIVREVGEGGREGEGGGGREGEGGCVFIQTFPCRDLQQTRAS